MNHWIPIHYRDFWDVPRIFLVHHKGKCFLFDCVFDEEIEDYPDSYKVYAISEPSEEELAGSWDKLQNRAIHYAGEIPVRKVRFDPSKRREIDAGVLEELMSCRRE